MRGYGVAVTLTTIINGREHIFLFGHLVPGSAAVGYGETVSVVAGQLIGKMDDTGYSTVNHLHYELRAGSGSRLRDLLPNGRSTQVNDVVYDCAK
jgi:murein DD-endopeptidase MepM/ murein hydrolase activator NlpD